MARLYGLVMDKNNCPLSNCDVALLNDKFEEIISVKTDLQGKYEITTKEINFPFLYIVKDYACNYLEFWGVNIELTADLELNCYIGKYEVYALNCFEIKCPIKTLSLYFRPMSLIKYLNHNSDVSVDLTADDIFVEINKNKSKVVLVNKVNEYIDDDNNIMGYLIQVDVENINISDKNNEINLKIYKDGEVGQSILFYNTKK